MAKDNSDGAGGGAGIRASYLPQRHMREMQHVRRGRTQSGEPTSEGGSSALLVIDMQNYTCHKDGALFTNQSGRNFEYFWERLETVTLPKLQMLLGKCRSEGVECIYTVIECLTRDCRDNSADYRVSGLQVPKGCWDARVLKVIEPHDDEIVIPKTSCNVFVSTNIDFVLRCLGVKHLIVSGTMNLLSVCLSLSLSFLSLLSLLSLLWCNDSLV